MYEGHYIRIWPDMSRDDFTLKALNPYDIV